MLITIKEITTENIVKGKSRYSVATVAYDFQGNGRTQKVMSFANPAVFEALQGMNSGDVIDVTVTKNDAGFNQWAAIKRGDGAQQASSGTAAPSAASPGGGKAPVSNYETREERAQRQVYIIRQSSLERALDYCKAAATDGSNFTITDVLDVADQLVDYVMNGNAQGSEESMD